jgi:hypothetical protein
MFYQTPWVGKTGLTASDLCDRFNNAGVAGEGSREGYEDVDSKDPSALSKKMLESSFEE